MPGTLSTANQVKSQGLLRPGQRLSEGKALGRIRFAGGEARNNVTVIQREIPIDVLFATEAWMLTTSDFGNAHAFMNLALKRLEPLFPPHSDA
jgi:hypothetical protein